MPYGALTGYAFDAAVKMTVRPHNYSAAGVSAAAGAAAGAGVSAAGAAAGAGAVVGAGAGAVVAAGAGAIPERVTGVLIAKEAQMLMTQMKMARLQVAFSMKSVVLR